MLFICAFQVHFIVLAYTQHAVPDCTLTAKDELWLAKKG